MVEQQLLWAASGLTSLDTSAQLYECRMLKERGMPTQTYENHRHNPRLSRIGFLFVLVAIVGFGVRWLGVAPGLAMAIH